MKVFGHQACGVLHRHGIAREGHHARAEFHVQACSGVFSRVSGAAEEVDESDKAFSGGQTGSRS
jgi:hypothetical protein